MKNETIKATNDSLSQFSQYKLKQMWLNGEIHRCPRCKQYHVKTDISWVKTNVTLCDKCQQAKDYYEKWEEQQENNEK